MLKHLKYDTYKYIVFRSETSAHYQVSVYCPLLYTYYIILKRIYNNTNNFILFTYYLIC